MLEVHYTESDRQRLEACVRREVPLRFYQHDDPTITQLLTTRTKHYLLLLCTTINMYFITFYRIAITTPIVLGLGVVNLCWQPSVTVKTSLRDCY